MALPHVHALCLGFRVGEWENGPQELPSAAHQGGLGLFTCDGCVRR